MGYQVLKICIDLFLEIDNRSGVDSIDSILNLKN